MSMLFSRPLTPCEDDVEQEMLLLDEIHILDHTMSEDYADSKSTSFLILLTISIGGYVLHAIHLMENCFALT